MLDLTQESQIQKAIIRLLNDYSFDSGDRPIAFVIADWFGCYPPRWIMAAVIEALYQGRYKTISVEQILIIWHRRGAPLYHFNHEFERIICNRLQKDATENDDIPIVEEAESETVANTSESNAVSAIGATDYTRASGEHTQQMGNIFPHPSENPSQPIPIYSEAVYFPGATSLENEKISVGDRSPMLSNGAHASPSQPSDSLEFELAWTPDTSKTRKQNGQTSSGQAFHEAANKVVFEGETATDVGATQERNSTAININTGVIVSEEVTTSIMAETTPRTTPETMPESIPSLVSPKPMSVDSVYPASVQPPALVALAINPQLEKSRPLRPFDPNQHKVPLPSFEPEPSSNQTGDHWQHWSGQSVRHCPIHQFQPDKAPLGVYNKLKAIARFGMSSR